MTICNTSTATHVCPKCNAEKPLTREFWFPEIRENRGPFKTWACRICQNIARRESCRKYARQQRATEEGRLAQNAAMRRWKANNPDNLQEARRKYKEKQGKQYFTKERRAQDSIEKDYDRLAVKNAYQAFKWWFSKKTDKQVAEWYAAMGKPWLSPLLSAAEKWRIRYRLDPEYRAWHLIRCAIRKQRELYGDIGTSIRNSLVLQGRCRKTEERLGYTMAELRTHLERQFTKKMTWEKFMQGEIHIDHIHPKKSFDLSDPEQWKVCWSLPNLRPLWASDNRKKSAKVLTLL
jgi:hypothetical protein